MHVHANNQCMLYFNTFLCHLCCLFSVVFFSFHTHITLTLHCSNLRIILGLYTFEIRYKESFFQYFEMIKYGLLDPIKPEGIYDTVYHPNRI